MCTFRIPIAPSQDVHRPGRRRGTGDRDVGAAGGRRRRRPDPRLRRHGVRRLLPGTDGDVRLDRNDADGARPDERRHVSLQGGRAQRRRRRWFTISNPVVPVLMH